LRACTREGSSLDNPMESWGRLRSRGAESNGPHLLTWQMGLGLMRLETEKGKTILLTLQGNWDRITRTYIKNIIEHGGREERESPWGVPQEGRGGKRSGETRLPRDALGPGARGGTEIIYGRWPLHKGSEKEGRPLCSGRTNHGMGKSLLK